MITLLVSILSMMHPPPPGGAGDCWIMLGCVCAPADAPPGAPPGYHWYKCGDDIVQCRDANDDGDWDPGECKKFDPSNS